MEKKHNILILFFALVVLISLAGFFNSYIRFLPDTDRFPIIIHIHFIAFMGWFALIIVQPILIRQKKYVLHRNLGRFTYILAPILVITILWLVRAKAQRELPVDPATAGITLLIGLLDAITFSVCYLIAMLSRKNIRWHVAFIIGATLIVFNPGLSRLLNHVQPGMGLPAAIFLPFVVPILIITIEKIRGKRAVLRSPYLLFICVWSTELLLFITMPKTGVWTETVSRLLKA